MTVTLTIQLFSTLSLLALWVWTRRRDKREVSRLAAELAASRATLHEFMQETEATFAVFSRMVHKAEPSNRARSVAPVGQSYPSGQYSQQGTGGWSRSAIRSVCSGASWRRARRHRY